MSTSAGPNRADRSRSGRAAVVGCLAVVLCCLLAVPAPAEAKDRRKQKKRPKREDEKAWLDAKGMCVFRFPAKRFPGDADGFDAAFTNGWLRGLNLPDGSDAVTVRGGRYPAVESLRVDLSDARVDTESKAKPLKPTDRRLSGQSLRADRFELVSRPLRSGRAKINLDFSADDVRLDFGKDKRGRHVLLMTDARNGRLDFEMTRDDIERLLLASAKEEGGKRGLNVTSLRLRVFADEVERTVRVDIKVEMLVGIVPAGLRFKARLDIDENLNGQLRDLSCTGDNILGPLISGFIQPGLKKHNGKVRPLVRFPMNRIRLRDVKITADETVRLTAAFGS